MVVLDCVDVYWEDNVADRIGNIESFLNGLYIDIFGNHWSWILLELGKCCLKRVFKNFDGWLIEV